MKLFWIVLWPVIFFGNLVGAESSSPTAGSSWQTALAQDQAFFYRALSLTRDYDADRADGLKMMESPAYRELQNLRIRWEENQRAIAALEMAAPVRATFLRALSKSLLDRLTHANLIDHLLREQPAGTLTFATGAAGAGAGIPEMLDGATARRAFAENRVEIEKNLADYRRPRLSPARKFFEPFALVAQVFKPSPGPEGNINGGNFPDRTWALTFDDGPNPATTPLIIDDFIAHRVKLTFFHLAELAAKNPAVIARSKAAGFALANHSYTHEKLSTASPAVRRHEIIDATNDLAKVYGFRPQFFRLPYGAGLNDLELRKMIADEKMIHVFWNVDSLDWSDRHPDSVLTRVRTDMARAKHGVVLMHDIHATTVTAAGLVLKYLESLKGTPQEVRLVTLPQIVNEMNGK